MFGAALALAVLPAGSAGAAAPEVPALSLPADVRVEGLAALSLRARDPDDAIAGVAVDFGDGEEQVAERACQRASNRQAIRVGPFAPGTEVGIELPYAFVSAGLHVVTVDVTSGDCQGPTETVRRTLLVTVLPVALPPVAPPAGVPALTAVAAGGCPDANLRPSAANVERVRAATLCLMNVQRAVHRLRALRANRSLEIAAAGHSRDMIRRGYFAHQAPSGGPGLVTRVLRARYATPGQTWTIGENLAAGAGRLSTPARTVAAWMRSPGHRHILLSPLFREVGVGPAPGYPGRPRSGGTYTADFGRRSLKR